jgi:hypothetical protein
MRQQYCRVDAHQRKPALQERESLPKSSQRDIIRP